MEPSEKGSITNILRQENHACARIWYDFTPYWSGWRYIVFALMMFIMSGVLLPQSLAAQKKPASIPVPNLGKLLNSNSEDWLEALGDLRKNPGEARKKLVQALRSDLDSVQRWRVYHHLAEFGEPEDIPYLVEKLWQVEDILERQALMGTMLALYRPAPKAEDLAYAVSGFSFIRKKSPRAIRTRDENKFVINDEMLEALHRSGLSLEIISKVSRLRGTRYSDREDLRKVLEKTLGEEMWELHGNELMEQFQLEPPRAELVGVLRVEMRNPRPEPILVELNFDAWSGSFSPDPPPAYLFIEGEQTGQVEVPVEAVWQQDQPLRVDMRMREVNGANVPVFQKLFIEG